MPQSDPSAKHLRDICRKVNSHYDREALSLLCRGGVLPTGDNDELDQAILRLSDDHDGASGKIATLQEASVAGNTIEKRRRAMLDLEQMEIDRRDDQVTTAYLLGIAVGRRLGPEALRVTGGAR